MYHLNIIDTIKNLTNISKMCNKSVNILELFYLYSNYLYSNNKYIYNYLDNLQKKKQYYKYIYFIL